MTDSDPPDPRPLTELEQLPNDNDLGEEGPDGPVNDPPHMPQLDDDDFMAPPGTPVL